MNKYNDIYEIQKLPKHIDSIHAAKSIEKMQIYEGYTAYVKLYYYDYYERILKTINTMGYVMFRTPDTYGHWGFVIKGNQEEIATLIKVEGRCEFELYDQKIRKNIKEGEVVQIDLDWKTLEYKEEPLISSRTILNANEFKFL